MARWEKTEHADRKRMADPLAELQAEERAGKICDPVFRHGVVVGFDGSESSERALAYASGMATRLGSGLIIVHVINQLPLLAIADDDLPFFADAVYQRTEAVRLELACVDYLDEVSWILVERGGHVSHQLEEVGQEYSAETIVVGATHGIVRRICGSVPSRLARYSRRPVIVIP